MHEYHAVEALVNQITEKAKEADASKVKTVTIILGEQLGFSEESIQLYFESMSDEELFKETKLVIKKQPGRDFFIENIEIET